MTVLAARNQQIYRMDSHVEQEMELYKESLDGLDQNSKIHINMLTILAEENSQFAEETVDVITSHILQVEIRKKLPALYLVDSIVKNVTAGDYKTRFRQRLIGITAHIFQVNPDEKVRRSIFRLRETWTGFFDAPFLAELDRRIQLIDPKWQPAPLSATPVAPQTTVTPAASQTAVTPVAHQTTVVRVAPVVRPLQLEVPVNEPSRKLSPARTPPEPADVPSPTEDNLARKFNQSVAVQPVAIVRVPDTEAKRSVVRPIGSIVKNGISRIRTEIPQKRDPAVSVSMGSLEPPKPKAMVTPAKKLPLPAEKRPDLTVLMADALSSQKSAKSEKPEVSPVMVENQLVISPLKEELKALPRIPRKPGVPAARVNPQKTLQASPRRRLTRDPNIDMVRPTMGKIPKKPIEREFSDGPRRKMRKIDVERPPENRTLLPSPMPNQRPVRPVSHRGGPVRPGFQHYPAPPTRVDHVRHEFAPRHRPYPEQERPRWTPPDYRPPFYPPADAHFPPPRTLLPAPVPMVDPRAVFEMKLDEDVKLKVASGVLNESHVAGYRENARREFELQQLQAAVSRSLDPIHSRDFSMQQAGGPINFVSIDEVDHEVWWVQNKPVVIKGGAILDIGFQGTPVDVFINDIKVATLAMHESRTVYMGTGYHTIKFGGPNFELILDDTTWCRVSFDNPAGAVMMVDGLPQRVRLGGPAPLVEIKSVRLNDQIFGQPAVDGKSTTDSDNINSELQRILQNPHFAGLLARTATPPVADQSPPAVAAVIPTRSVPEKPAVPEPPNPLLTEEQNRLKFLLLKELNSREAFKASKEAGHKFVSCPTLIPGPPPAALSTSDDDLYLGSLEKLRMNIPFCCTRCEERFLPEEREGRIRNITVHNGFTQKFKDGLHVADWLIGGDEFVSEKSFECDTSVDDLVKMFADFTATMRVGKPIKDELQEESASNPGLNRQESQTAEFDIVHRPVVESKQRNVCGVCLEDILAEEMDDELDLDFSISDSSNHGHGWILKDGLKATSRADGTVNFYHRDCFDQNVREKPITEVTVIPKPNRWASTTIDTPVPVNASQQRTLARRPLEPAVHPTTVIDQKPSFPSDFSVPAASDDCVVDQDSVFVITTGYDDDDMGGDEEDEFEVKFEL